MKILISDECFLQGNGIISKLSLKSRNVHRKSKNSRQKQPTSCEICPEKQSSLVTQIYSLIDKEIIQLKG